MNENKVELTKIPCLCYWVQHILPLVYDESLSYMELLAKVTYKVNELIENNNNLHLSDDDVWFETAKYQFEVGDYKESYDKLKLVVEDAGFRYFEGEDPKYLDFYKNPEKYIKS